MNIELDEKEVEEIIRIHISDLLRNTPYSAVKACINDQYDDEAAYVSINCEISTPTTEA